MMFEGPQSGSVRKQYELAKKAYAQLGVDADKAIARALAAPISLHCWQADDVGGFEVKEGPVDGGGILATGSHPGRARNGAEVRQDLEKVMSLLPGVQRVNIHALYAETGTRPTDRDELKPRHFTGWIDWAKKQRIGLDFNTTFYAHPYANEGATLSHADPKIREFWIRHAIACRHIAEHIGKTLKNPCVLNHWLPDGMKDYPADRWSPRARLLESLDTVMATRVNREWCVDAVEGKLFGIGSEEFVVGSNEFYNCYALTRGLMLCLDMGHFHPTETIHDKVSALLQFHERLLIHVSRPVRWDSDHVVLFNDDTQKLFQEIARGNALNRVVLALDYFDASINRIAAYVIGARAARKAILFSLLEPAGLLRKLETTGHNGEKLAFMEELKSAPFGAVWDMLCVRGKVPAGVAWIQSAWDYEEKVLSARR